MSQAPRQPPRRSRVVTHSFCAVRGCVLCDQHADADLEECGQCDQYHPKGYTGDCRDDRYRFPDLEAYITWKVTGERPDLSPAGQRRVKEWGDRRL